MVDWRKCTVGAGRRMLPERKRVPMQFAEAYAKYPHFLTEGALGQRLEREYGLEKDPEIGYAGLFLEEDGRRALDVLLREYLEVAQDFSLPMLLMLNTRRSNEDRVERSRYAGRDIFGAMMGFIREIAAGYDAPVFIGGTIGSKGDGYTGDVVLTAAEAEAYHTWQIEAMRAVGIDFYYAAIMPVASEVIGLCRAAERTGLPVIVSLMLRRNGRIPGGETLAEAVAEIDGALQTPPLFYMTNCVHPNIVRAALSQPCNRQAVLRSRFCGLQANAADAEPEELDGKLELVSCEPDAFARDFRALHEEFPLRVLGGCCGTDARHLRAVAGFLRDTEH